MTLSDIPYTEGISQLCTMLSEGGVFLMVNKNPMTIGWASVGVIWGRPIIKVLVRPSRYSHQLLDKTGSFCVSIPQLGTLKKELSICGSRSGRDIDKIKECNLPIAPGKMPSNWILTNCQLFYEAQIVQKNDIRPHSFAPEIAKQYYSNGDYHTAYYGEIKHCYRNLLN